MKNSIHRINITLVMATIMLACNSSPKMETIHTSDFELGKYCSWTDIDKNKIYKINDHTDFHRFTNCKRLDSLPNIDFSKNTLILVRNIHKAGVVDIAPKLVGDSKNLRLEIEIEPAPHIVKMEWIVAILAPKIVGNKNIKLKITEKPTEAVKRNILL